MAARSRRIGCGCLPFVFLVVIGAVAAIVLASGGEGVGPGVVVAVVGAAVLLSAVAGAVVISSRRAEEEAQSAQPPPRDPEPTFRPTRSRPERSAREIRSGPRGLTTEPETDEAQTLKRRLAEAVSDLADNVEEMPKAGRGETTNLSSEEMIARAKRRIRQRNEDPDR